MMKHLAVLLALLIAAPAAAQSTSVPNASITQAATNATALATQATAIGANATSIAKTAGNKKVINWANTINSQAATLQSQANALSAMMLAWVHGAPPPTCTINSIALSNNSFTGGASSGTVVGTISVSTTGSCGTDTLSLTGTNASSFQISGTNLETNGVVAAGAYSINIVATISGATGSPYTQPETITGTSASVQDPGPSAALFAAPYYTCSTNKYIATAANGGSDSNPGTSGSPWLTLAHADSQTPTAGTCINVGNGTYAAGLKVTHGGNLASSTGYVVYRCATLLGCTITDPGSFGDSGGDGAGAVFIGANYVQFDGFIFSSSPALTSGTAGFLTCGDCTAGNFTTGFHHIWLINSEITGYGVSGFAAIDAEYLYIIHSKFFGNSANSGCNGGAQGSGLAINGPIAISGYSRTADDGNNPVTGNTGTLFYNFVDWNVVYNNHVTGCGAGASTDGNGIILDTSNWNCSAGGANCSPAGATPYLHGTRISFNVVYNNGGAGIHVFGSMFATVANNSSYNNYIDTGFPDGGNFGGINSFGGYGNTILNNVSYVPCVAHPTQQEAMVGAPVDVAYTTTLNGTINASVTSVVLASATHMPGNGTFSSAGWVSNADYRLPGGNMIQIDSEIMQVTAGWGTTTLTVTRGFQGTTGASHTSGATVTWVPDYFANNVSNSANESSCPDNFADNGDVYLTAQNKAATATGWTNVGNSSQGTDGTQPNGTNFALAGGSAAIAYGNISAPFTFLNSQGVDAGACYHTLSTCP
jgi:hypothetical protein